MDFFPPGKSKHTFWLKNSQRREVGPDHWWPESSLSPRNGVEARNLATQPRRYFCIFATMTQGCTSLDLPSQNLPTSDPFTAEGQLRGSSRRKAGVRDSPLRILSLPLPCLQLLFQWRAGVLEFSVLESFLVTLPSLSRSGAHWFPWGAGPGGEGCRLWV